MGIKQERLEMIGKLIRSEKICNQEELLKRLEAHGFSITQATLSRDIKHLKVVKIPDGDDNYVYRIPDPGMHVQASNSPARTYRNIEFSGNLVVMKTRPGYAMGIASDIDTHAPEEIVGTIAGDDTILVIPREGYAREQIADVLAKFIQQPT